VKLAETLLGRGYDLRIYDPYVSVTRLRGANLAYVDRHLPHLAALLVERPEELLGQAQLLVLATGVADDFAWSTMFTGDIFDLRRDLVAPAEKDAADVSTIVS
jgi:GDP-mannose 6-dehydrogenase